MPFIKALVAACLGVSSVIALAQEAPDGDARRGQKLFVADGCYQCHGYQGQGSNAGSKLAPNPLPYAAMAVLVRQPRARMPAYSSTILPDQDLADIHAYLATIPRAKAVDDIPLLRGARSTLP
ncbi:MAG: cytochrome c [Gammaproteobacteria bacterium]|nr:cytochrome c [Gammaproteobacteria bacterium]